ncbi:MAG TPA: YciI family protein [Gammaproteobacteria bacterium]|nr:YciI family protein [Gammaproteobacteria bacterium]
MFYAIIGTDVPDSLSQRAATRPRHLEYIRQLIQDGRVLLAGPLPAIDSPDPGPAGMTGSLIVVEFESLSEAEAWAAADPYSREGVFESVAIKPFLKVHP